MKICVTSVRIIALFIAAVVMTDIATAQPITRASRITAAEAGRYSWPTFRQVKNAKTLPEVKVIQFLLRNQRYYKLQPDGVFGDRTTRAVRAFQRARGLKIDGIVGPQTWPPLLLRLRKGDRGDAVRALQTMLRETTGHEGQYLTRDLAVDGLFGDATQQALRIAQEEANWFEKRAVVDGIAGPQTWSILLDGSYQP